MKKVITYGTFDLLHEGHINLLRRAKALGDYLIVGVTSDNFDRERGKLNVRGNVLERIESVKNTGIADKIIIEDYVGQKIDDIQKYNVNVFAIGSDWEGKFDYLTEFCQVEYLPRTEGISSTMLRSKDSPIVSIGIIGSGRIARRFMKELPFVAGARVEGVYNPVDSSVKDFASNHNIKLYSDLQECFDGVDAVYVATPHLTHYYYIMEALRAGCHVLCEIPLTLSASQAQEAYDYARKKGLVLLEASKTAFCPAFNHLISLVKSGTIGEVVDVRASLSKLVKDKNQRELNAKEAGGSMTELSHLPLLSIIKLFGKKYVDINFHSKFSDGADIFTKGIINYAHGVSAITLGLGVKTEGNLVISGTEGYAYVPAPWWLTDYFEIRYEDQNKNKKYFYPYEGEGLRYELHEFVSMIMAGRITTHYIHPEESIAIISIIEAFLNKENVIQI